MLRSKQFRLVLTGFWIMFFFTQVFIFRPLQAAERANAAAGQLASDPTMVLAARAAAESGNRLTLIGVVMLIGILILWRKEIWDLLRFIAGKRNPLTLLLFLPLLLSACGQKTEIKDINANQTAFLIPIAGNAAAQQQLQSIDFLRNKQVAAKQISIEFEWKQTGAMFGVFPTGDWYPTTKLITVDRSIITREWTQENVTGTSPTNESFGVESIESVGFAVGATCTAIIDEGDAATFLYYYGEKGLAEVMDSNVRGFVQKALFNEFGSRTVAKGQADKRQIFQTIEKDLKDEFKAKGITILSFGGSDGMVYSDPKVQESINASYAAQQKVFQAQAQAEEQEYINQKNLSAAQAAAQAVVIAGEAQAKVMQQNGEMLQKYPALTAYTIAQKSSGAVPQILVLQNGGDTGSLPFSLMLPTPAVPPTAAPIP